MIKTYKYNDTTQLTPHFNVQEFRCKCGQAHDILINTDLVDKLEQLFTALRIAPITEHAAAVAIEEQIVPGAGGHIVEVAVKRQFLVKVHRSEG